MCLAGFFLGSKTKNNIETTGNILGKVKVQEPIFRTEREEIELEERLAAEGHE
jgi:hypothetical protein